MEKNNADLTEEEWKEKLTPKQYHILRERGTEMAFTGEYEKNKEKGMYKCAGCGTTLFSSDKKFESGSGWPSFSKDEGTVATEQDTSHGMKRTEVLCEKCGGHLGHVFDDGPTSTGKRFCINSAALDFEKKD